MRDYINSNNNKKVSCMRLEPHTHNSTEKFLNVPILIKKKIISYET